MSTTSPPDLNSKFAWRLPRRDLPRRSPQERLSDFLETHGVFDEATAREQASRCLQCPNPGCVGGCPLCNPIPQWIALTAEGRFLEAAAMLGSVTNMAEICSRVCPQERLCESTCVLNGVSEPVAIRSIEQFLADYALERGVADVSTPPPLGQKVAVVGAGAGGLACADDLAGRGYGVTVFDEALIPGGLLVNGFPAFKLEKSIIERRVEFLRRRGVIFEMGVRPYRDIGLAKLREQFDAVYLGFDSRQPRPLRVPGGARPGVVPALPFILQKSTPIQLQLPPYDLENKRVVVLGGGDMAMVCARTAAQCGAREVLVAYRRAEQDMPCMREDYDAALEEKVHFIFCATPVAILGEGVDGPVQAVRFIRTEPAPGAQPPHREFTTVPGSEYDEPTDVVLPALGFDPLPCPHEGDWAQFTVANWGALIVDENQQTNVPGVYAGGDIVRGPCLILEAVRDARRASRCIHEYLMRRVPP
jgi:glutamate synthase (NADPH/NADH) small chain